MMTVRVLQERADSRLGAVRYLPGGSPRGPSPGPGINAAPRRLGHVMSQGVQVLLVALVLASAFGVWRAARDGRFRGTHVVADEAATPVPEPGVLADLDHPLGERATLLQFSSAFCAPCRATRRVLGEVADLVPGVAHVELDAEHHLDLVRRLGIV